MLYFVDTVCQSYTWGQITDTACLQCSPFFGLSDCFLLMFAKVLGEKRFQIGLLLTDQFVDIIDFFFVLFFAGGLIELIFAPH